MSARTLDPDAFRFLRSHFSWRGERSILYKGVETFFKNPKRKFGKESPKKTIYACGGLRQLHKKGKGNTLFPNQKKLPTIYHQPSYVNLTNYHNGTLAFLSHMIIKAPRVQKKDEDKEICITYLEGMIFNKKYSAFTK